MLWQRRISGVRAVRSPGTHCPNPACLPKASARPLLPQHTYRDNTCSAGWRCVLVLHFFVRCGYVQTTYGTAFEPPLTQMIVQMRSSHGDLACGSCPGFLHMKLPSMTGIIGQAVLVSRINYHGFRGNFRSFHLLPVPVNNNWRCVRPDAAVLKDDLIDGSVGFQE